MTPEHDQLFLDGLQVSDIQRLQTEQDIRALEEMQRLERINLFLGALSVLITEQAVKSGGMLNVVQLKGVDEKGLPYTELHTRSEK